MRIVQKEVLRKWEEIAKKYNVSVQVVKDVESSIWKYVKQEMSKGIKEDYSSYKHIYLRFLGTFFVNKRRFNKVREIHDTSTGDI